MGSTVFLNLEDIALDLPELTEEVVPVEMDGDLADAYHELENKVGSAMREMLVKGSRKLLGTYLNSLLCYPDRPFQNEPIIYPEPWIIAVPLPQDLMGRHHLLDIVPELTGPPLFVYSALNTRTYSQAWTLTRNGPGQILHKQGLGLEVAREGGQDIQVIILIRYW
jgi:hypothetical protein